MTTRKNQVLDNSINADSLKVYIAKEIWEKKEIYKLRYQIYVQEMAKSLKAIGNREKMISDPLDDRSILLYVQAGSEIVATMRLTIAVADGYPSALREVFHMDNFKGIHPEFLNPLLGLATKLAVEKNYRNSPALYLLLVEMYRLLREQLAQILFGGCNPYLLPLYERMGLRKFTKNFTDPGYGLLIPLVGILGDLQYLQLIRSPLCRQAKKYINDSARAQLFLKALPSVANDLNIQLASKEDLWKYAEQKLNYSPAMIPLFKSMDEESILQFLYAGTVFSCMAGDCIVYPDNICSDLYILLSGELMSKSKAGSHLLRPGDYFGNLTNSGQLGAREMVSAIGESEIFILPRQAFERYQYRHRQATEILYGNLNCIQNSSHYDITNLGGHHHE